MAKCVDSILMFGDSGDGKTAQIGQLAEMVYTQTGKKTRVYSGDGGGWRTIQPYVSAGIVEPVDMTQIDRPWEWLQAIVQGKIHDGTKWIVDPHLDDIGALAYEGLTGFADMLMADLSDKSAKGINVGGGGAFNFRDGDTVVGSNNQAHYGQVQSRLYHAVSQSQRMPVLYVVWTAMARRGQDADNLATILGPQVCGKALTSEVPRWFVYTFRLMAVPANPTTKQKEEHRLYFHDHLAMDAAGAKGLGNDRTPLDATPLPEYIAPASIVKALELAGAAQREAEEKVRARIAQVRRTP